jgi:hypothetical protein
VAGVAWVGASRLGEVEAATRELQNFLAVRVAGTPDDWTSKVGHFLAGQTAEPEFLFAAKNADSKMEVDQLCQAYFYAGQSSSLPGTRSQTRTAFENRPLQT